MNDFLAFCYLQTVKVVCFDVLAAADDDTLESISPGFRMPFLLCPFPGLTGIGKYNFHLRQKAINLITHDILVSLT